MFNSTLFHLRILVTSLKVGVGKHPFKVSGLPLIVYYLLLITGPGHDGFQGSALVQHWQSFPDKLEDCRIVGIVCCNKTKEVVVVVSLFFHHS